MPEARNLPAEGFVEQDVLGRGGDPLFGAYDIGDAHEMVIDYVGEVVGGEAVRLHQYLIVDVAVLEGDVAAKLITEGGGVAGRHLHADDVWAAFGEVLVDLCLRKLAVGSVVARGEFGGDLAFAQV